MHTICFIILVVADLCLSMSHPQPLCRIESYLREECGFPGISQPDCERRGCCYDDRVNGYSWCYNAMPEFSTATAIISTTETTSTTTTTLPTTPLATAMTRPVFKNGMSLFALVQMKRDNVPLHIITSLLADSVENGAFLYAVRDGKLDSDEFLELSQTRGGLQLSPMLSYYASGGDLKNVIYNRLAQAYNVDSNVIQLMMSDKKDVASRHLIAKMSRSRNLNPMSNFVLSAMTSEMGITRSGVMGFVVNQMFKSESMYSKEALKAIMAGNKNMAIRWSILAANQRNQPLEMRYPKNEAIFAYMVDTQNRNPGKITPTMILTLALGEKIAGLNPEKNFMELFGVKAMDYVCASHHEEIRLPCRKLSSQIYPTSLECIQAGCCLRENEFSQIECFDNLLGSIGVALATRFIDEEYIIDNIFDGELPTLAQFYPDGIPWIPSKTIPARYTSFRRRGINQPSFFDTYYKNGIAYSLRPTILPTGPSKFRPNYVWKPHGVTPFPNPTFFPELDSGVQPVVTSSPGAFGSFEENAPGGVSAIIKPLSLNVYSSCHGIEREDRYFCLPNSEVLYNRNGRARCEALDCCYDPIWDDVSIYACFRKASYGQCHTVDPSERRDCGEPGISKDDCLADERCCYDSTTNPANYASPTPWCYYKKQSFVTEKERCSKVSYDDRVGCFPSSRFGNYNNIVSKVTCENANECCYEKVRMSFLDQALGKKLPPTCFKKLNVIIARTVAPPTTTTAEAPPASPPFCSTEIAPGSREDCGASDYHTCVNIMECCYIPEYGISNIPWCFKKSK